MTARLIATAAALVFAAAPLLAADVPEKQNLKKGDVYVVDSKDDTIPDTLTQAGILKPYKSDYAHVGLRFTTGSELTVNTTLKPANSVATTMMGVAGKGTHVKYTGKWHGDASGGHPILVLTDHGKMTWTEDAEVDFVMASNFFTRQLWLHGDGTGTLELAEGLVADRTQDATVPDAMGTIRLGGATLITHHSQSLPYNSRPDGRGGIYHNGHVVFEQSPASTWIVKTNQHIYSAQIDFATHGTIDCQAPLTHNGHRRVCLQVGNGGPFTSTGAFRTTRPDVTITKTGPAMLSLEGQQSYLPGSKLIIKQGLVRIHTDPGAGKFINDKAGPFLDIIVEKDAKLHFAAPLSRVKSIEIKPGGQVTHERQTTVEVTDQITVHPDGQLKGNGTIQGKVDQR